MHAKKNNHGVKPSQVPEGWEALRVCSDELKARHRSGCDREPCYYWGRKCTAECNIQMFRCSCGAEERGIDHATGEILEEEMA